MGVATGSFRAAALGRTNSRERERRKLRFLFLGVATTSSGVVHSVFPVFLVFSVYTMKPVILPEDEVRMNEDDRKDLEKAKKKNKETTNAARRALKVARETQEIAEHTVNELHGQTHKIRQLDGKMVEMKEDVKKSESYLRYISRAFVCCNCFVTDPNVKEEGKWERDVKKQIKVEKKGNKEQKTKGKSKDALKASSVNKNKEKLKITSEMVPMKIADGDDLKEIDADFQQQDKAMDEISTILTNLNGMSKAMGDEIQKQNNLIEEVDGKATPLKDRMKEMNTR